MYASIGSVIFRTYGERGGGGVEPATPLVGSVVATRLALLVINEIMLN